MYSIKAITTLTGLTAETLRAWERRYDCITPHRNSNGRRSYSQNDLEKLKLLVNLTRNGHAIGKIAGMNVEELCRLQQQAVKQQDDSQSVLCDQIIEEVQAYRLDRYEQLLKRGLIANEPLDYARDILLPTLQKVGQLWHDEKINIAQEHMFSCCVKRIVLTMVNNLHQPSVHNPTMLFATPSGDTHEFGILLSCLVAAAQQYTCFYAGPDLPARDIIDASRHLEPDVIVLGLVKTPADATTIEQMEQIISAADKGETKVWIGGAGANHWYKNRLASSLKNCELIGDIDHFHAKAQQLRLLSQ